MRSKRIALVALLAAMAVSARAGLAPLSSFENVVIGTATPEATEQAIRKGADEGKWKWRTEVTNEPIPLVRCTFDHRKYQVVVDVVHGPGTISVRYCSSKNMRYDPVSGKINPNYNKWVEQLVKDIQKAASEMPRPPPPPPPPPLPSLEAVKSQIRDLFERRDAGFITDVQCDKDRGKILESLASQATTPIHTVQFIIILDGLKESGLVTGNEHDSWYAPIANSLRTP